MTGSLAFDGAAGNARAAARIAVGPALSPTAENLDKSTLAWRNARNAPVSRLVHTFTSQSLPNPNRGADTTGDGFNNGVWHMATP